MYHIYSEREAGTHEGSITQQEALQTWGKSSCESFSVNSSFQFDFTKTTCRKRACRRVLAVPSTCACTVISGDCTGTGSMWFVVMHVTMWSPFAKTINLSINVSPPQDASSVYRCQVLKKKKWMSWLSCKIVCGVIISLWLSNPNDKLLR